MEIFTADIVQITGSAVKICIFGERLGTRH